jgi:hypothetical protein
VRDEMIRAIDEEKGALFSHRTCMTLSFVIVGAGGFVGVGKHDVAIPVQQDGKFVLSGATKEAIKTLPKFEYPKK